VREKSGVTAVLEKKKADEVAAKSAARVAVKEKEKATRKKALKLQIVNRLGDGFAEMTAAEWAATPKDYKSILVSKDGTHRYRSVMKLGGTSRVFLIDRKVSKVKGAGDESGSTQENKLKKELDKMLAKRELMHEKHMQKYRNGSATRAQTTTHNARVSEMNEQIIEVRKQLKELKVGREEQAEESRPDKSGTTSGEVSLPPSNLHKVVLDEEAAVKKSYNNVLNWFLLGKAPQSATYSMMELGNPTAIAKREAEDKARTLEIIHSITEEDLNDNSKTLQVKMIYAL